MYNIFMSLIDEDKCLRNCRSLLKDKKELKISIFHKEGLDGLFQFKSFGIIKRTDCFVSSTFP
jgi:hypothetical protein